MFDRRHQDIESLEQMELNCCEVPPSEEVGDPTGEFFQHGNYQQMDMTWRLFFLIVKCHEAS
jgi:hypothetical protein